MGGGDFAFDLNHINDLIGSDIMPLRKPGATDPV